jgi:hypothetical protein
MIAKKPDDRERWANNCLAKANYCEFAAAHTTDNGYEKYLRELADKWKHAAKQEPNN